MSEHFDRLLDLAKRTGDPLIVHDPLHGQDVVVMSLDYYEMLISANSGVMGHGVEPAWHTAGAVLEDRFEDMHEEISMPSTPSTPAFKPSSFDSTPVMDDFADPFSIPPAPAPKAASSELHVEELPYDAPFSEENKTPFGEVEGRFGDDDPVFLEEPV